MTEEQTQITDEEIELQSYLGTPAVQALSNEIGPKGTEIVAAAWRDGFSAGADAVENAIERAGFDSTIFFTETSGAYKNDLISVRATFLDNQLYLSEGFNHNEQEHFATQMLSEDSIKALTTLVTNYNRNSSPE
jgi:hypothetical protein